MTELHAVTVAGTVKAYLCCSCGACGYVCPESAIHFEETTGGHIFPVINDELCTECGKCLRSCAGTTLAVELPDDPFAGEVLGCWVGKATDEAVYNGSQSGGGVTAILLALVAEGVIEGAVTVGMGSGTPPRPFSRIARTRDEILAAQGSKYCPIPVLTSLKDLTEKSGPVALVGLACQLHGLHNLFQEYPELRAKVSPVIGLVCERILTYGAIDYFFHRSGMADGISYSLRYKSKEWRGYPGDVRICNEGNDTIFLPGSERMKIKNYFTPARCRLCFDKMNVLADITAGDPWGLPEVDRKRGESTLIARTPAGLEAVLMAVDNGQLLLREVSYDRILDGQQIDKKRREFAGYCAAWSSMRRPLPAQAETVLRTASGPKRNREIARNLHRALMLDQFRSRRALVHHVRNRLRRREIVKKIKRAFTY